MKEAEKKEKIKVGKKPKYKNDVKTELISPLIPTVCKSEILESIDKITKPYQYVK